tara:strand:+ start:380 stop:961 length:582 start_codon:yes stop_codon:yes gene_type:complete
MTGFTWILKLCGLRDVALTANRQGTSMNENSQVLFINLKKYWSAESIGLKSVSLLVLTTLFFFTSSLHAAEEVVKGTKVIREGPPPLEDPQYLDLGTFVVNMPGDKYFLKSSIQLAFENSAAKDWLLARLPIAKDLIITHLNSITVEQFDDTKNRVVIKNDLQIRLNSLFPNKAAWEDSVPIRRILFSEFYRQ